MLIKGEGLKFIEKHGDTFERVKEDCGVWFYIARAEGGLDFIEKYWDAIPQKVKEDSVFLGGIAGAEGGIDFVEKYWDTFKKVKESYTARIWKNIAKIKGGINFIERHWVDISDNVKESYDFWAWENIDHRDFTVKQWNKVPDNVKGSYDFWMSIVRAEEGIDFIEKHWKDIPRSVKEDCRFWNDIAYMLRDRGNIDSCAKKQNNETAKKDAQGQAERVDPKKLGKQQKLGKTGKQQE